jgi:hypothetical protein
VLLHAIVLCCTADLSAECCSALVLSIVLQDGGMLKAVAIVHTVQLKYAVS